MRKHRIINPGSRLLAMVMAVMLAVPTSSLTVYAEDGSANSEPILEQEVQSDFTEDDNETDEIDEIDTADDNETDETDEIDTADSDDTDLNDTNTDVADDNETDGIDVDVEENGEESDSEDNAGISDNNLYQVDATDISGNDLYQNNIGDNSAVPGDLSVKLEWYIHNISWDTVPGADGYEIQFAIDKDLAPDKLTDSDFKEYGVITESHSRAEILEDGKRFSYGLPIATSNLHDDDKVLPIDPDYQNKYNYFPVLAQYAVYRVRAVSQDENGVYHPMGEFLIMHLQEGCIMPIWSVLTRNVVRNLTCREQARMSVFSWEISKATNIT